jgi:hypothetical protein
MMMMMMTCSVFDSFSSSSSCSSSSAVAVVVVVVVVVLVVNVLRPSCSCLHRLLVVLVKLVQLSIELSSSLSLSNCLFVQQRLDGITIFVVLYCTLLLLLMMMLRLLLLLLLLLCIYYSHTATRAVTQFDGTNDETDDVCSVFVVGD